MTNYQQERIPIPTPGSMQQDLLLRTPPFWMIACLIGLVVLSWVPLVLVAKARVTLKDKPRIHLIQDMDNQPRLNTQAASAIFADGRAMRLPVPGTVARGMAAGDDHYDRGFTLDRNGNSDGDGNGEGAWQVTYFDGLPALLRVNERFLMRGQERFNIYCAPCHGLDGAGHGPIHQRAIENEHPAWVPPTSMHTDTVRQRPDGHLYNTIRNGIRNMPGYGSQIAVEDRWAIVAYVRALQRSQQASLDDVPPQERGKLR